MLYALFRHSPAWDHSAISVHRFHAFDTASCLCHPTLMPAIGSQSGLSISLALRPVPARIVQQIQRGQFVDMRELLADNIALRSQLEQVRDAMGAGVVSLATRPRVWEVASMGVLLPNLPCCRYDRCCDQRASCVCYCGIERGNASWGFWLVGIRPALSPAGCIGSFT